VSEWASGNVYIRTMGAGRFGLEVGEVISGHTHNFDHTSIFFNGRWKVKRWSKLVDGAGTEQESWVIVPGDEFERDGPFHLLIHAGCKHEFTYLGSPDGMPGRAWCVYSHRNPQGEVVDNWNGWSPAYT
jgi:hypothetical protein